MNAPATWSPRELAKAIARAIALLCVLPLLLTHLMQSAFTGRDRSLEDHTEVLALVPGLTGRYLRRAFLSCVLDECHPTASIGFGTLFSKAGARIGAGVYIG